jgi:hypothetical protein
VDALVEGNAGAEESFQRHGAGNVGESGEASGAPEGESADGGESLRAIEECEAFLTFEANGIDGGAAESLAAVEPLAAVDGFAFANDAQGEMGERGEISAGADRAFLGDDGMDTAVEHESEGLGDAGADATVSEREGVGAEGHHDAGFGFRERLAEAAGMAADKVELEAIDGVIGNTYFAELAEARVDAIDGSAIEGDAAHDFARLLHLSDGGLGYADLYGMVRNGGDFGEFEGLSTEFQHSARMIPPTGGFLKRDSIVE